MENNYSEFPIWMNVVDKTNDKYNVGTIRKIPSWHFSWFTYFSNTSIYAMDAITLKENAAFLRSIIVHNL